MDWVETGILLVHVAVAVALVVLVLVQQGKGADAGAAFGGGSSQTVFGSSGGVGFMVKLTAVLAALFFVTSFALAMYAKQRAEIGAQEGVPTVEESSTPEQQSKSAGQQSKSAEQQGKSADQVPDIGSDSGASGSKTNSESAGGGSSEGNEVPSIE